MDHVDIFLSYAREDEARVQKLVHALEAQGWRVFWDREIPAGESFVSHIQSRLDAAAAVIVAWSRHSVESEFVYSEASRARGHKTLVPVLIDRVTPPLGLDVVHAADLVDWMAGNGASGLPATLVGPLMRLLPQPTPPPDGGPPPQPRLESTAASPRPQRKPMMFTMLTMAAAVAALVVTFFALGPEILPTVVAGRNPHDGPIPTEPQRPGPIATPRPPEIAAPGPPVATPDRSKTMPTSSRSAEPSWRDVAQWCETATQPPTASQSTRIMPGGQLRGSRTSRDLFQQAVAAAARNDCAMAIAWMIECRSDDPEAADILRINSPELCRWLAGR